MHANNLSIFCQNTKKQDPVLLCDSDVPEVEDQLNGFQFTDVCFEAWMTWKNVKHVKNL